METAGRLSVPHAGRTQDPELRLYVVFTGLEATKPALEVAFGLARDLRAQVVLLIAKVVPYPLPLEAPPVCEEFTDRLVSQLVAADREMAVRVSLCRDRDITIGRSLGPRSLVVMGRPRRWWPDKARPLARLLKRQGHEVILVESGGIHRTQIAVAMNESTL